MQDLYNERRKEPRVEISFPATIQWTDPNGQEMIEQAQIYSISNSGAALTYGRSLPLGEKVKVTVDVGGPSGSSFAEIKWVAALEGGYTIGLAF